MAKSIKTLDIGVVVEWIDKSASYEELQKLKKLVEGKIVVKLYTEDDPFASF